MKFNDEIKYLDYYGYDGTLNTGPHRGAFISFFTNFNGCFFILCDSASNYRSAVKASEIVISSLQKFYNRRVSDDPISTIRQALKYANQKLYFVKQRDETIIDTDIQCMIVWKTENKLYYASVGDINLFYFKGKDILSMNSFVNLNELEKKSKRQTKGNEAGSERYSGSMGDFDDVKIVTCENPIILSAGDGILLCPREFSQFLDKTPGQKYSPTSSDYTSFIKELENDYNLNWKSKQIKLQFVKFKYSSPLSKSTGWEIFLNTLYIIWHKIYNWKYFLHIIVSLMVFLILFMVLYNIYLVSPLKMNPIRSIDSIEIKSVDSNYFGKNFDSIRMQVIARKQLNRPIKYSDTVIYYRVKKGETLYRLSIMFNQNINSICIENNLFDQKIQKGQVLKIHIRAVHKLLEDENIVILAAYYNVSVRDILEANNILSEKELKTGDDVFIPRP
jgi:hypothetical protein